MPKALRNKQASHTTPAKVAKLAAPMHLKERLSIEATMTTDELLRLATGSEEDRRMVCTHLNEMQFLEACHFSYKLRCLAEIVDNWGARVTPKEWRKKKRRD